MRVPPGTESGDIVATEQRSKPFRPWVWVAILPTLFAINAVLIGMPLLAPVWLLFAAAFVFLAWRGRKTPWWSAVGWLVCVVGVVNVIGSSSSDESPAVGLMLVGIGGALGVTGLVVNGMKQPTV